MIGSNPYEIGYKFGESNTGTSDFRARLYHILSLYILLNVLIRFNAKVVSTTSVFKTKKNYFA